MSSPRISVVLPVMNQVDHIARVLAAHAAGLASLGVPYEIIPVVNGSTDGSFEACASAAAAIASIRPFEEERSGYGRAIIRGLREATGDVLCFANSARTSTADLVYVLRFALRNPEFVAKANRSTYDNVGRRIGSIGFNLLCRSLFGLRCWDMNGTPKVFSRRFERLMQLTQVDTMIDVEFNAICYWYGYPMIELPLAATPRHGGKSLTNVRRAFDLYIDAIRFAPVFRRTHVRASTMATTIADDQAG